WIEEEQRAHRLYSTLSPMPSFHPPVRPLPRQPGQQTQQDPMGWMQQLAQKDDLLLWVTAVIGVLMPGVIYLVYTRVHVAYMRYARRKEATRLAEEKAKEELAIFYTRGVKGVRPAKAEGETVEEVTEEMGLAERRARQLEEYMGEERPKMRSIEEMRLDEFGQFKGFAIFLVECSETGHALESYEWFLDWLETVAAEKKERKRLQTGEMKYAILGMSEGGKVEVNRAAETLSKRLRILGASSVVPDRNFDKECEGISIHADELFQVWAEDLFLAIDRFGLEEEEDEYDDEAESEGATEGEESGEESEMGDVPDPVRDGMRRRKV
ncbi:hypothetical protein PENTCL1PPCAC_12604, partial [Pristionchus entomophagus]